MRTLQFFRTPKAIMTEAEHWNHTEVLEVLLWDTEFRGMYDKIRDEAVSKLNSRQPRFYLKFTERSDIIFASVGYPGIQLFRAFHLLPAASGDSNITAL